MDPLSVIASIAGVATAGIALSRAIYDIISSVRNAPKEASDIARGLCDLSLNFRELRRVLKDGQDIYRRKLINRVASAIKRVSKIQDEIKGLLDITGKGMKLRWLFRKSKIQELLYAIESHKTGINLILQTMLLAVHLKQVVKDKEKKTGTDNSEENEESRDEVILMRQQAENMVQMSYHSIRELASEYPYSAGQNESEEIHNESPKSNHVQRYDKKDGEALDTAAWLYDVIFSAGIAVTANWEAELKQSTTYGVASNSRPGDDSEEVEIRSAPTQVIVARQHDSRLMQLHTLNKHPPVASLVVNGLLCEWTTLTEAEIAATDKGTPENTGDEGPNEKGQFLRFTDAVGRKFSFPFDLVREWQGMETMIKEAFLHVDVLVADVWAGNYDIIDAEGNLVMRAAWQDIVKPGEVYRMTMCPVGHGSASPSTTQESSNRSIFSHHSKPAHRRRRTPEEQATHDRLKKERRAKIIKAEDMPLLYKLFR